MIQLLITIPIEQAINSTPWVNIMSISTDKEQNMQLNNSIDNIDTNINVAFTKRQKQKKPRSRDEIISKQLSWILRHGALQENLPVSKDGFISLNLLLKTNKLKSLKATKLDILRIVENDEKQRYSIRGMKNREIIDNDGIEICANQGHSIKEIKVELEKISKMKPGEHIIHGTNMKNWKLIKESGYLSKMNRNHIHFSIDLLNNDNGIKVISGMRQNSTVFIYVSFEISSRDNIEFFKSKNNVILSNGINGKIPLKYFEKVIDKNGESLL